MSQALAGATVQCDSRHRTLEKQGCVRACIETNAAPAFLKEVLAGLDVKRIIEVYSCARSGLAFKAILLNPSVPQDL